MHRGNDLLHLYFATRRLQRRQRPHCISHSLSLSVYSYTLYTNSLQKCNNFSFLLCIVMFCVTFVCVREMKSESLNPQLNMKMGFCSTRQKSKMLLKCLGLRKASRPLHWWQSRMCQKKWLYMVGTSCVECRYIMTEYIFTLRFCCYYFDVQ